MRFPKSDARTVLAFGVTVVALVGITALSITAILSEGSDSVAQGVLNAVLPLFGAWVGTVLAYYFSRDNFEAASSSTERLVRELTPEERLRSIAVTSVMTRDMTFIEDLTTTVQDAQRMLDDAGLTKLPILRSSRVLLDLVYLQDLQKYLLSLADNDQATKTIEELLADPNRSPRKRAFVAEIATLAETRDLMHRQGAKVAFVTENGLSDEPVLGLITNTDIAIHARV